MNKERRNALNKIHATLTQLQNHTNDLHLDDIKNELETLRDDEQGAFDNMPESMQQGERGQQMENAIQEMETAIDALDTLVSAFDEIETALYSIDNATAE